MERKTKNCAGMESQLADVLLDPERASAEVLSHLAECEDCRRDLEEVKASIHADSEAWSFSDEERVLEQYVEVTNAMATKEPAS